MYYKNRFMFINCLIHNKKKRANYIFLIVLYFVPARNLKWQIQVQIHSMNPYLVKFTITEEQIQCSWFII